MGRKFKIKFREENLILNKKVLKIFVCTHKIVKTIENDIYYPLLCGAWDKLDNNDFLRDDLKENISKKNLNYSELTGIYWIWKNIESDYKGICHYRRYFNLKEKEIISFKKINKDIIFPKNEVENILEEVDLIVPKPIIFKEGIESQYLNCHNKENFMILKEILYKKYSKELIDTYFKTKKLYPYNMFITRNEIFNDYSKWLFEILSEVEQKIKIPEDKYQARVFGFMSERLLGLYIELNNLKTKEVYVTMLSETPLKDRIKNLKNKILNKLK